MFGYNAIEQSTFVGVVEDRNDPLKARRVRVRCFFIHPEDKTLIPTEHLPWARVATKITLKEGDHVRGYFEDGPDRQMPVITEQIIGIPEKKNEPTKGFNDPRTDEELKNAPRPPQELKYTDSSSGVQIVEQAAATAGYRLNEPISNRLIRGEFLQDYKNIVLKNDILKDYPLASNTMITSVVNTSLAAIQSYISGYINQLIARVPGLSSALSTLSSFYNQKYNLSSTYTFPESKAAPQYPYNNAVVSESGHIQEVDDTPGAERIHTRHRSGTYEEYQPDGDYVQHIRKDNHQLVDGQDTCIVRGKKQVVVEGSETVTVRGARYIQIEGTSQIVVLGDANLSVQGSAKQYIKGNFDQVIGGTFTQTVNGTSTYYYGGDNKTTYNGNYTEKMMKDWKQSIIGEWTFRFEEDFSFRFEFVKPFAPPPATNKNIVTGVIDLPQILPDSGNQTALNGPEFSLTPTVTSSGLDKIQSSNDPSKLTIDEIQYDSLKVVDNSGMFIV